MALADSGDSEVLPELKLVLEKINSLTKNKK